MGVTRWAAFRFPIQESTSADTPCEDIGSIECIPPLIRVAYPGPPLAQRSYLHVMPKDRSGASWMVFLLLNAISDTKVFIGPSHPEPVPAAGFQPCSTS